MDNEYIEAMNDDFSQVEDAFKKALSTIRTGRASPKLLENIQVEVPAYGARMPINQLASIQAPDARLLVVNPWDKSTMKEIEKAIGSAGLGLNPSNDGQIIRVPIPALTADRRQDLIKKVGAEKENHRVRARGVRKEYNDLFKGQESDKEITEDELKRLLDQVQKATDACNAALEKLAEAKEAEISEV